MFSFIIYNSLRM